jgi:hypothetical protein
MKQQVHIENLNNKSQNDVAPKACLFRNAFNQITISLIAIEATLYFFGDMTLDLPIILGYLKTLPFYSILALTATADKAT